MYSSYYVCYLYMHGASEVQKSKNRFVRADVLFAVLASDFGVELVVGEGPFREPPTVMQATISYSQLQTGFRWSMNSVRQGPLH